MRKFDNIRLALLCPDLVILAGGVRVRDHKLEPHQFRIMVDINSRQWLVFVRFSVQTAANLYAYELLFVGKYRQGMRARYVGKIDEPLPDGRILFHPIDSLHNMELDKNAWWVLNKCKIPIIGKRPGPGENPYLPHHVVKDERGRETHEPAPFEPNDFVTFLLNGQEIQAYVLRRHDPVCAPATRLYVLLCVGSHEFVVYTVYARDIRPPRIQDVVRPKRGDLWWVKYHEACIRDPCLELHLQFCMPPREGFKRGHIVSVPSQSSPTVRVCACISNTWILDGRMNFKVFLHTFLFPISCHRVTRFQSRSLTRPISATCTTGSRPSFTHTTCLGHLSAGTSRISSVCERSFVPSSSLPHALFCQIRPHRGKRLAVPRSWRETPQAAVALAPAHDA